MLSNESLVNLSPKKTLTILNDIMDWYSASARYKEEKKYNLMMKECYRFYRGIPIQRPITQRHLSNYWKPLTFPAVETIAPRLMSGMFATDPFFRYMGSEDKDFPACDNLSKVVYFKLMYEVPFMLQMAKVLKNALVYGFSACYSPWLTKQKTRYMRDIMHGAKKLAVKQFVVDAPWCMNIPFWDLYAQPGVESIHDGDGVIIREVVTRSQLWQRALAPTSLYLLDQVEKIVLGEPGMSYPDSDTEDFRSLDTMLGLGEGRKDNEKIELLHYFGTYNLFSDSHNFVSDSEVWITIANRTQVVLAAPNPYDCQERPVFEFRPAPNTHGLIGIPIPQMARDTQLEANDQTNLRLDSLAYASGKVLKVRRHSDIYERLQGGDMIIYPGATVPVDNMDDIDELVFQGLDPSLFVEDRMKTEEFDKALGIHDITAGRGDPRARTATGTSLVIREANYRFDFMLRNIVPSMARQMQFIGYLTQQYALTNLAENKTFSLVDMLYPTNRQKFSFSRQDIQCDFYSLILSSSTRGDKSYHFAMLQSLYQMMANNPHINLEELTKQLLEEGELKNIDLLLKKMPVSPAPGAADITGKGPSAAPSAGPGVVSGMAGLGGPTEAKNLRKNIIQMSKDTIQ